MYVVGHCIVTEKSGTVCPEQIYGSGIFALMLPDYARCHDWGYSRCFDNRWSESGTYRRLIHAHLLGDWFAHYGSVVTTRRREGWAYRHMAVYARRYHEFFALASKRELRKDGPLPDSVRGFSHTMVEYTIDTHLARRGDFDEHFPTVKDALGTLGIRTGIGSRDWIRGIIERARISTQTCNLEEDVDSFRDRIALSNVPEDFAINAGVKKFGLRSCQESRELVQQFLLDGLSEFRPDDIDLFVEECGKFIGLRMRNSE